MGKMVSYQNFRHGHDFLFSLFLLKQSGQRSGVHLREGQQAGMQVSGVDIVSSQMLLRMFCRCAALPFTRSELPRVLSSFTFEVILLVI